MPAPAHLTVPDDSRCLAGFVKTLEDSEIVASRQAHQSEKAQDHAGWMDHPHPAPRSHLFHQTNDHVEATAIQVGAEFQIEKDVMAARTHGSLSRLRKLQADRGVDLPYDRE